MGRVAAELRFVLHDQHAAGFLGRLENRFLVERFDETQADDFHGARILFG
jgi:hypothetical protein